MKMANEKGEAVYFNPVNKNGKLTARKKGSATITVKAGKVKATVKVTVTK